MHDRLPADDLLVDHDACVIHYRVEMVVDDDWPFVDERRNETTPSSA